MTLNTKYIGSQFHISGVEDFHYEYVRQQVTPNGGVYFDSRGMIRTNLVEKHYME